MAVTYGLANYKTGDHILDLPVIPGASWGTFLNKPDSLSCEIDLRDPDVRALDIPSSTEPKLTVLFAQNDDGNILAWGVISDRTWNNDTRRLGINASGAGQYFNQRIIAPPGAANGEIVLPDGSVSTAFDTLINDVSLGSIGKRLIEQALSWTGAPTAYVLPADVADPGRTSGTYRLVDFKRVGAALDDLTNRENGPDFAFDAVRDGTGLALEYRMRFGNPLLGTFVGSWPVDGPRSPVTELTVTDDGADLATHVWMQAGKTDSKVIVARSQNADLLGFGYPVLDLVDTTRTDVSIQQTLDDYALENSARHSRLTRSLSFTVRGGGEDGGLMLGQYRPGDFAQLDVAAGNPYLAEGSIDIRITGISGDETGQFVKIGCEVGAIS